jgi:uncharacterized protein YraI
MSDLWTADPDVNGNIRGVDSVRTPGTRNHLDPDRASTGFYRSMAIRSRATSGGIRIAAFAGSPRSPTNLRSGPSTRNERIASVPERARLVVRGALTSDAAGRTWVPVMTRRGQAGWVAAWIVSFGGTATTRTSLVLRKTPSLHGVRVQTVRGNARVTILASGRDAALRTWLKVRTPLGRTGWIAAWLTRP